MYKNDHAGYLNHTLSYYPNDTCYYFDYRYSESGDEHKNFERTPDYYKLLAARLLFVVLFQYVISLIQLIVDWIIPDVPQDIQDGIKRDAFLINKLIYEENVEIVEMIETQV
jgi:anoctamin-1